MGYGGTVGHLRQSFGLKLWPILMFEARKDEHRKGEARATGRDRVRTTPLVGPFRLALTSRRERLAG